jgi:uncharacterized protein DUF3631
MNARREAHAIELEAERAEILERVSLFIRRFVSLSESQAQVVALWVVHTHVFESGDATPYLAITSAEKQSGKTRLLEVLVTLVAKPWFTGRVSAAVLIRKIHATQPTLLLDESDAAFGGEKEYAEALRGVLNTGHRSGGNSSCCVGRGTKISYQDFSTFCPKAIAGIGKLPDTVADRAIPIRLKRAAPGEVVERFRLRDVRAEATALREEVETWCLTILETLPEARPQLPDALTDRQQDGAEPLLVIADIAGGAWPQVARQAVVKLCTEAQVADDSTGKLLLADIRQVFEQRGVDRLPSAELAIELADIETSPWNEWSQGKPLSAAKLARLLKPFGISPHSIRVDDKTPKGYEREDFQDAFRRYLRATDPPMPASPAFQTATPQQANAGAGLDAFSKRNSDTDVAASIYGKPSVHKPCCGVALSTPPTKTEEAGVEED